MRQICARFALQVFWVCWSRRNHELHRRLRRAPPLKPKRNSLREQANKALAENALGLIPKHGRDAAARFLPELKYRMGTLAAKRAEFISNLMGAHRELRSLKATKSQTARPEIMSSAGATAAAGAQGRAKGEINPAGWLVLHKIASGPAIELSRTHLLEPNKTFGCSRAM